MADVFVVTLLRSGSVDNVIVYDDQNKAIAEVDRQHQYYHMYADPNDYITLDQVTVNAGDSDPTPKSTRLVSRPLAAPIRDEAETQVRQVPMM
ncbi:hypothetical protein [Alicyclobacillus shizuokensis]|uniref:hypothetical protein n=1 Tax=Alicyclobacillus shizuokensis TaxID=392014 RepID=UPI00082C9E51|nr:hypothetical protein [Alicyclobacillus shizuokensis]